MKLFEQIKKNRFEMLLISSFLAISSLLMWKTFKLDTKGNMMIASRVWSDFAATIPLIRSFSFGSNFPPEYPIFANAPIRYHFLFYYLVGIFEKIGLPLSWSLNIPSIIGFTLLLSSIYFLGRVIFKKRSVGLVSVVLFLFNGSFAFLEFIKTHSSSTNIFSDIIHQSSFSSFGPYDGKIVSAFWNLNIYTNQRHLAFAYSVFLFILLFFYKKNFTKKKISVFQICFLGVFIGLFPFVHLAVFGMIGIMLVTFFLLFPKIRVQTLFVGLIAIVLVIPQVIYMGSSEEKTRFFNPGYLIDNLTILEFVKYWFLNLGLTAIIAPLGFLEANKKQRKALVPFLFLFIIGNLFQLSPEIAANHKFFNLFIIGLNLFTAYFLVKTWGKNILGKVISLLVFPLLIFSGILDIFPIANDSYITIEDIPNSKIATYIYANTPKTAVFLNSSFLYNPASIAGRKIMMGWPYFSWSAGYDTDSRGKLMNQIYTSYSRKEICGLLRKNHIDYFTIQDTSSDRDFPNIDLNYFKNNFTIEYSDQTTSLINVSTNCF